MKKIIRRARYTALVLLTSVLYVSPLNAWTVTYKEQFYKLYHIHYNQYPDDVMENIYWLERAVEADFCNPLYALARITTKDEWEKYRYLFMMHLNLKLAEQHMRLGAKWDKMNAYFYNAPWKEQNLDSLNTAETCYLSAQYYWREAQIWAEKAGQKKFQFLFITDVQQWEDERYKIAANELNYGKTLDRQLERLKNVRAAFEAMDETTY